MENNYEVKKRKDIIFITRQNIGKAVQCPIIKHVNNNTGYSILDNNTLFNNL